MVYEQKVAKTCCRILFCCGLLIASVHDEVSIAIDDRSMMVNWRHVMILACGWGHGLRHNCALRVKA